MDLNGDLNICISNCFFKSITYTNHGGAISIILTTNINLLIEENTFFEISISGGYIFGGAIYLDDNIGNFILNKNCGNYCFLEITNSYIDHVLNMIGLDSCHTSKNNLYTFTNTYKIFHFKSIYCFSENPYEEKYNSKKYKLNQNFLIFIFEFFFKSI